MRVVSTGRRGAAGRAGPRAPLNIRGIFFASLVLFVFRHSLKYLNVSANALGKIPPSCESEESLSTLQELYLTGNNLTENCGALLVGHQNLRVLHIAYNQLLSFPARCVSEPPALIRNNLIFSVTHMLVMSGCYFSKLSKLEQLEELNLSGNKLKTIPSTVSSCKRLHTLIAHSNHITVFPEILNLPEIKVRGFSWLYLFNHWGLCSSCISWPVFNFPACGFKLQRADGDPVA